MNYSDFAEIARLARMNDPGYRDVLRCLYCGGVPTGNWPNCDYCGARVRRGQRVCITTIADKAPRYIEVES